ncbi:MAG: response regulator transcription factor [Candidatus Acidiferrales bacterium]
MFLGANCRVRVLIADDHPLVRKIVRSTLQQDPQLEICGEAQDGAEAIEEVQRLKPDVVVLDLAMPILGGFDAAREIKIKSPGCAIVILSSSVDQRFVDEARKIGICAYVAKTKAVEALVRAVEAAVQGEDFIAVN